jgi:hypothetical protein
MAAQRLDEFAGGPLQDQQFRADDDWRASAATRSNCDSQSSRAVLELLKSRKKL